MNEDLKDPIEAILLDSPSARVPRELRGSILSQVHDQLRSSAWDHRLAKIAGASVLIGAILNFILVRSEMKQGLPGNFDVATNDRTIVEMERVVTEATDRQTGSQFGRQLALLTGQKPLD